MFCILNVGSSIRSYHTGQAEIELFEASMAAIACSLSEATSNSPSAGPMCTAASSSSPHPAPRRSPAKCSNASPSSMPLRARSVAEVPMCDAIFGRRRAGRYAHASRSRALAFPLGFARHPARAPKRPSRLNLKAPCQQMSR